MVVHVRVNGSLAEALGSSRHTIQVPQGATVSDLLDAFSAQHPGAADLISRAVAVAGGKHVAPATKLAENQEMALLMPIAGG